MKLELNMYIRTKNGNIRKIVEVTDTKFIEEPDCYVDKVLINIEQNQIEDTIYMEKWLFNEDILKASHNIIDLIEENDYINGLRVEKNKYGELYTSYVYYGGATGKMCEVYTTWLKEYKEDEIYSIVTKEQFSQMEYKL